MRVLHLITTICRGGAETQLLTLVREQVNCGIEVSVIYLKGDPELISELESAGAVVNSSLTELGFLRQMVRLYSILPSRGLILHAHLPRAEIISALVKKRNHLVVSKHNAEQFFPRAMKILSRILALFVEIRSCQTICISKAVMEFLHELGEIRNLSQTSIVYYGYNSNFLPDSVTHNPGKSCTIGTIARLTEQKDLPTLLRGFAEIQRRDNRSKLVIIGRGSEESHLVQLATKLAINKNITWISKSDNVYHELSSMKIFVLTSKYEGFGLVLLEAMQVGIPIVASRNSAIPEVLGEKYEYFFSTGDEEELAAKIVELQEPANYARTQKYLLTRLAKFSPEKMSAEINQIYENCLG